jgi:formylglycine-generating enzyme required for sulfatase activity
MQNILLRMEVLKTLFTGTLIATLLIAANASAQLSNVEGIEPIDGVEIPKVQIIQPQTVKPGAVFKDCDVCPEMVVIPSGSFLMGSPPDPEPDPFSNAKPVKIGQDYEKPQHRVNIQSFSIGKYEVTQEQWFAVMGNNPSRNKGRTLPVENISWDDTQVFVKKLSQKTGKKYRLPSEAEWEYAARGGSTTTYPWGNSYAESHVYAWFNAIANATNPVGLKKPNQFGLYDMLGNVWEWTQDCFNEYSSDAPTDQRPWISGDCNWRVLRGGSWTSEILFLHSAFRDSSSVSGTYTDNGLRIARGN